ncbi:MULTISPECIES: uracil-DNA glycosylase [Thermomonospora]|uniref:Type-5 uracil-DNA glycosylase n=1 Tax=Thermomonospora curvata (strain ATCC 19995 / DSM 43183 / JCM 3096 / KCTC 9072 / NBRC 15933 / NCIMB 10081 / Henssen B9) TaxID=471852 RepID=D1A7N7_THECD|nr:MULTISPECIES: uracil-DNA glycosylase [Thermomonospora]ACY96626.1 Uracil-DNA glycosylase superfamily [Thermomonospora curvata DSM 43183]PKK15428.1 MAG: uracil-DNA glycosylase [Thermomonospora sp. CIF 1]
MTASNAPFVPPGTGWPGDPATPRTPVAGTPQQVRELADQAPTLQELCARQSVCRACPRLVDWREQVALRRRRAFADQQYWGRPVPGWGQERPRLLIVGLAPAAHGGNRTGRIFTGDRSGDWLFASLHRTGLAELPTSVHAGDGQRLPDARMVATVRCAPPANKPTPAERTTCLPWLEREVALVAPWVRVIVALGGYAWQGLWPVLRQVGYRIPRPRPAFGHGVEVELGPPAAAGPEPVTLLGCYHPSQQNTFTGRVTEEMLDAVFTRARDLAGPPQRGGREPVAGSGPCSAVDTAEAPVGP